MSDEEENNEEEEKEEEEGEEEEDEEKEDGEDAEKEDGEEEEKAAAENNTVKDKQTAPESTSKFETEKLVPSNEIKLDLANGIQNISPLTLSAFLLRKQRVYYQSWLKSIVIWTHSAQSSIEHYQ